MASCERELWWHRQRHLKGHPRAEPSSPAILLKTRAPRISLTNSGNLISRRTESPFGRIRGGSRVQNDALLHLTVDMFAATVHGVVNEQNVLHSHNINWR